jgi:catechol 2,3-dioxygenase-like lactoylglutathione lyase family enzyme
MELNSARVFVREIASARRFYEQTLGLRLKADGSEYGYCVFESGCAELIVESVPEDAPEEDRVLVGRFTGLSFTVEDAEAKHRELEAIGVRFTGLPEKQFWGGVLATFQDPSGNELQIVQHPAAERRRQTT